MNMSAEREFNSLGKSLLSARKQKKLTLRELVAKLDSLGISTTCATVSKWERGEYIPGAYQLIALCAVLGFDAILSPFGAFTGDELNREGLAKLADYRADLIASGRYKPRGEHTIIYIDMPVSVLPVSAGSGAFLEEESFETVSFPKNSVPDGAEFGIRVSGDSMEPVYHDGQIVWVQRCTSLNVGETGVFMYGGSGYLKVYGERAPEDPEEYTDSAGVVHKQPVLISYNRKYEPIPIRQDCTFAVAGRVLG